MKGETGGDLRGGSCWGVSASFLPHSLTPSRPLSLGRAWEVALLSAVRAASGYHRALPPSLPPSLTHSGSPALSAVTAASGYLTHSLTHSRRPALSAVTAASGYRQALPGTA